jgi:KRAB domain-containing zinc finger protein
MTEIIDEEITPKPLYKCPYSCEKYYFKKSNLEVHIRRHEGDKAFICKLKDCGDQFYSLNELNKHHRKIHTKEKMHGCHCGKEFYFPSHLKIHQRTHVY